MHLKKEAKSFILGSSSVYRKEILFKLGFNNFTVASPDIDEEPKKKELPRVYAERMAREKVEKLKSLYKKRNILTADTVACCGRRILPKALTNKDVEFCLNLISGRRHRLYTSVCLAREDGSILQKTEETMLKFKRLSQEEISFYLKTKEGIGKAGGYSIQGVAQGFLIWMSGSYLSVVGLPAYQTINLLKSAGIGQLLH